MAVEREQAVTVERDGVTYYCSRGRRLEFLEDLKVFTRTGAAAGR